ncbi:MAG: hypothetical protein ETSY2_50850 [Candidatus Entotheonella gemina]|uniref:3-oxoacyl-ACP synthase n=1 Tax=Candidatus Entotheonella gemina TaxID=1429439 RepID=W4L778_9BACT|nr:MAG: hypothetical protein ETSY2_50850 [Candidatus Entotheonella gemina]
MGKMVRYTSDELKNRSSQTDWDAVRKMTDEEIEASCEQDPVWQEMGGDDWMDQAELVTPRKQGIYAKFDEDVIAYYKSLGRGYQARMNAVLRAYMEAHPQNNP